MSQGSFSKRHGYAGQPLEITVREDAPESLRFFVLAKARELGLTPGKFRDITCSVLEERPNPDNWSPYPKIWNEVEGHVYHCAWYQVYDVIERVWQFFKEQDDRNFLGEDERGPAFAEALNDFFIRKGIGWQLADGAIVTRGPEAFEETVKGARQTLENPAGRRRGSIFMRRWRRFQRGPSRICTVRSIMRWDALNVWRGMSSAMKKPRWERS